jgi:hypothetical protein
MSGSKQSPTGSGRARSRQFVIRWTLGPLVVASIALVGCSSDGQHYEQEGRTDDTVTTVTTATTSESSDDPTTVPTSAAGSSDTTEANPDAGANEGTLPPNGSVEQQGGDGSTGYTEGGGDTRDDGESVGG